MNEQSRFARVEALFREACRLPGEERDALLDRSCADDPALRREVEVLLEMDEAQSGPLDEPPSFASSLIADARMSTSAPVELPRRIGGYRVIRRIGTGGMGTVFEAEQDNPRRAVALKVISPGLVSRSMLRRFQFETELLARLQHPGIAQIYAAGTFDVGAGEQPFFAMELVDGTPLMRFASDRRLSMGDRLALLAQLCDAVQHAHGRGVIHRDLKPANVLVTPDGQPKILDFGVARATDSDVQVTTLQTNIGQIVGTVPYMSPEQAAGDHDAIDTRSDVYSLGVLGYELLTGLLPFDVREKLLHEALRAIREDEPTPLSTHSRMLAGDVATIVSKAIARDRHRRYESSAALAGDIRRFLNDEPIEARPPSVIYQIRKFTQRNRALMASLAIVVAALFVLSIGAMFAAAREHRLRQHAQAEADVASGINEFLRYDVLAAADPSRAASADVTILDVLDAAAAGIGQRFLDQPEVHAAIRQTIADTYITLGKFDVAETHLAEARRVLAEVPEGGPPSTIDLDATEARLRHGQGRYDEAESLMRTVLARDVEQLGPDAPLVAQHEHDLASILRNRGAFDEAVTIMERVLEKQRSHEDTQLAALETMNSLGIQYAELGEYEKSEAMYRQTLEARRAALGEDHWDTINTMIAYGQLLTDMQKNAEAEAMMLEAKSLMEQRGTPRDHPQMIGLINNLALLYLYGGRTEEAAPMFEEILEIGRRIEGAEHPNTLTTMHNLASAYWSMEDFELARATFEETLELGRNVLGPNHPETLMAQGMLGRTHWSMDDHARAVELLEDTYRRMAEESALGPEHVFTVRTAGIVADVYEDWEKPDDAAKWRAIAEQASAASDG